MRIRIEMKESGSVEIERKPDKGEQESLVLIVDIFHDCLLALGYHPDTVRKAVPYYEGELL